MDKERGVMMQEYSSFRAPSSLYGEDIEGDISYNDAFKASVVSEASEILEGDRDGVLIQYNLDFDSEKYQRVFKIGQFEPQSYLKEKEILDNSVYFNLQTMLGERYNASLSRRRDIIINGKICDINTLEPLEDLFERGRVWRANNGSSPHDKKREMAEVLGFKAMQETLLSPDTRVGTMVVSISPPGGSYKHNFYDVFTLCEDENGKYIDSRRYSSSLSNEEYESKIGRLKKDYFEDLGSKNIPFDVYSLSHLLSFDPNGSDLKNPADVHAYFHSEHETLSDEQYANLLKICDPDIRFYMNVLAKDPYDMELRNYSFNALLYSADLANRKAKTMNREEFDNYAFLESSRIPMLSDVFWRGSQAIEVRQTGCGLSGGALVSAIVSNSTENGIFGVVDYAKKKEELLKCKNCTRSSSDNHYHCPKSSCNKAYDDETHLSPSKRTKKCRCGFKFGCNKE